MRRLLGLLLILLILIPAVSAQTDTGTTTTTTTITTPVITTTTTTTDPNVTVQEVDPIPIERSGVTLSYEQALAFAAVSSDPDFILPPQWASNETFALVVEGRVNLRSLPSVIDGEVRTVVTYGERFPIVGIYYPEASTVIDPETEQLVFDDPNEREVWYLISTGSGAAWIFGGTVIVANPETLNAFFEGRELTPEQRASLESQVRFNASTFSMRYTSRLRSGPSTDFRQVGVVPFGARIGILGRNVTSTWFYINYNGNQGWVSFSLIALPDGFNALAVPVIP